MLLTIDIGNTSTKLALFERGEIVERHRFPTVRDAKAKEVFRNTDDIFRGDLEGVAIASVVTELSDTYRTFSNELLQTHVRFFDHTSEMGFSIDYDPPSACGPDRLVAAHAAVVAKGYPVITCDFGTATTIDLVNDSNIYCGGIIAPGVETMAASLFENTSRLPWLEVKAAHRLVGNSTERSIRSGIYYGYLGLADGIIGRMQAQLETPAPVIATGGFAELIAKESQYVNEFDPDLIHRGLMNLWKKSSG